MATSFASCLYTTILNINDTENLQIDLSRLEEVAFENEMIINSTKSKAFCFIKARMMEAQNYSLRGMVTPEVSLINTWDKFYAVI
jgi:hypothetical protein